MLDKIPYLAFLAPFALFFQQGRAFIGQLFSFFIRTDTLTTYAVIHRFVNFLQNNSKQIKFGNVLYHTEWDTYVLKNKKYLPVTFKIQNKLFFLYKNKFPLLLNLKSDEFTVTYFNIFNFDKLVSEFIELCREEIISENRKIKFHYISEVKGQSLKLLGGKSEKTTTRSEGSSSAPAPSSNNNSFPFRHISFNFLNVTPPLGFKPDGIRYASPSNVQKSKYYFSEQGKYILNQVQNWENSESWYNERDIRWFRGMLLYGKPGTGKSALILEIAKKLEIPIYIFSLSTLDNEEFIEKLGAVERGSIILFEDFDSVFDKRVNLHKSDYFDGLTFDCVLNKLSGVNAVKNCFLFITTNNIEKLDEALIRDGRIDEKIELKPLSKEGKIFIANKMLDLWPELIEKVICEDKEETAAEYENRVCKLAISMFWKDKIKIYNK